MKEDCIVYEYISINVKKDIEPIYIDCYKNFGWIHINNNEKRDYYINSNIDSSTVNIKFKRNRNIRNKEELNNLQRKCEKALLEVNKLEKLPQNLATVYSLSIGFIAILFIIMAIFNIIRNVKSVGILCMVIGLILCIFPYFIYKKVKIKKEIDNKAKVDAQQNVIYDIIKQVKEILLEIE